MHTMYLWIEVVVNDFSLVYQDPSVPTPAGLVDEHSWVTLGEVVQILQVLTREGELHSGEGFSRSKRLCSHSLTASQSTIN